jgi:3-hydroxybutyryl-CoA dehydrogenase
MGSGITLCGLSAGLEVALHGVEAALLDKVGAYLRKYLARRLQMEALASLKAAQRPGDVAGASAVTEAAPEDLELKRSLFQQLDRLCPPPGSACTATPTPGP